LDDVITYRIDVSGGQHIINLSGGSSLQSAYNAGSTITTVMGVPVTITGTSGVFLHVTGDLQVDGIII
jgi:hypothetical protein